MHAQTFAQRTAPKSQTFLNEFLLESCLGKKRAGSHTAGVVSGWLVLCRWSPASPYCVSIWNLRMFLLMLLYYNMIREEKLCQF